MLKTLIKISVSSIFSNLFNNRKKVGPVKKSLYGVLVLLLVFSIFSTIFSFFYSVAPAFIEKGNEWIYFAFSAIVSMLISVFCTFTVAQSLIYNSNDNELLLSLPIKKSNIVLSRIFVLLVFNYLCAIFVFVPTAIVYLQFGKFSVFGLIAYVVLSLLIPLFSSAISIIFAWVLTLLMRRMKRKSIFVFVFSLIFLFGYMYISFNLQNISSVLVNNASLVSSTVSRYLAVFSLYATAITSDDILNFVIFALIAVASFAFSIFIVSSTFGKFVNTTEKKIAKSEKITLKQSLSLFALLRKEFSRLISFPTYILNTTVGGILAVVFSVMLLIKGEDFLLNFNIFPSGEELLPIIVATILAFCVGMNSTTVASISLEGKAFDIIKSLPIEPRDFYNSKILLNLLYGVPITLIASTISCFAFEGSVADKIVVMIFPLSLQLFAAIAGLSINMRKPKFDWTNPVYPVKQSLNTLLEIVYAILLSAIPIVVCLVLGDEALFSVIGIIISIIVFVIDILLYINIMFSGKKYFENMS